MYTPLECIALRTVRISDTKSLLSAWTRQLGRVTFAFPAGAGREARRRRALCPPLALFEGVSDVKEGREVLSLRDLRPSAVSPAIATSPTKSFTAMFLAEVLDLLLKRSGPDEALSDFLFGSVATLAGLTDKAAIANFHLVFLFRLAFTAGIGPELEGWASGCCFDIRDARFRPTAPLHRDFLQGRECTVLMALSRTDYRSAARLPLDREGRRQALDAILLYFSIHLMPLGSLKSLEILRGLG